MAGQGGASGKTPALNGPLSRHELLELARIAGVQSVQRTMKIKGQEYFGYVNRIESVYGSNEFLGLLVPVREPMRPYMEKIRFSLLRNNFV